MHYLEPAEVLQLTPTPDLIAEIHRRVHGCLMITAEASNRNGLYDFRTAWKGTPAQRHDLWRILRREIDGSNSALVFVIE